MLSWLRFSTATPVQRKDWALSSWQSPSRKTLQDFPPAPHPEIQIIPGPCVLKYHLNARNHLLLNSVALFARHMRWRRFFGWWSRPMACPTGGVGNPSTMRKSFAIVWVLFPFTQISDKEGTHDYIARHSSNCESANVWENIPAWTGTEPQVQSVRSMDLSKRSGSSFRGNASRFSLVVLFLIHRWLD